MKNKYIHVRICVYNIHYHIVWCVKYRRKVLTPKICEKVPSTTYWLYVDENPVGFGSIRHFLTDALREASGNIGYGIAPKYREKGYGKEILGLLLKEANRFGIDRVLVTIYLDNVASKVVALAFSDEL